MADLRLSITGDGSGGAGAMREVAQAAGELDGATKKLGDSTKKAGESAKLSVADYISLGGQIKAAAGPLLDFAKQSIAAFEEQEKADRQLEIVAGDLTEAFKDQASQMQQTLGVSDDMVERMQTLALRYETLPTNVEPATRAILDWAAATGGDAESGMQTLLRSIEFGQDKIKGLGIEFESTGNKTTDLTLAVDALTKKFGGAADGMADTLAGRTSKLTEAFGELKESLGGAFDAVDRGLGFTDALSTGFRNLSANISDFVQIAKNAASFGWGDWLAHGTGGAAAPFDALAAGTKQFDTDGSDADPVDGVRGAGRISKTTFNKTNKADKAAAKAAAKSFQSDNSKTFSDEQDELDAALALRSENSARAHNERMQAEQERANAALIDEMHRHDKEEAKRVEKVMADGDAKNERIAATEEKHLKNLNDIQQRETKKQAATMKAAGEAVGLAFVNALGEALSQAIDGGEADATEIAIDTSFTILSAIGGALASYYGGPVAGAAVSTGLGLAGKMAKKDYVSHKAPKKKHDGGWIDSYHSGGWPGASTDEEMAMLQHGERVLSRQEVSRMGGKGGVEAAARGRGGAAPTFNISTLDSGSFQDFMGDRGGRGFFNAVRTGRGMLAPLLGG